LSASGTISGTPTTAGSSTFTVQVKDSAGQTASQPLSISITAALSITTTSLPGGTVGTQAVMIAGLHDVGNPPIRGSRTAVLEKV
jgi:hypothetical protein